MMKLIIGLVVFMVAVSLVSAVDEAQVFVDENTVIFTACTSEGNVINTAARITIYDDQDNVIMSEQFMQDVGNGLYKYVYVFNDTGVYHTRETCQFDSVMVDDGNIFVAAYPAGYTVTPTFWQTIGGWFTTLGESIGLLPESSLLINSTHIYDKPVIVSVLNVTVVPGDSAIIIATLSRDNKLVQDAWCEVDIKRLNNDFVVNFRSAFNNMDGTYTYNWSNTDGYESTEDFEVKFDCYGGDSLNLRHVYGDGLVTVSP